MKTKLRFTFLALLMLSGSGIFAQNSNLIIFSEAGEKFYVIMNGLKYNNTPETNVRIEGLKPAPYKTRILFENPNLGELNKTLYANENQEGTYALKFNEKKNEYILRVVSITDMPISAVYTPEPVRQPVATVPVTNPNTTNTHVGIETMGVGTSVTVTETQTTTTQGQPVGESVDINMNIGGINVGTSVVVTDGMNMGTSTTVTTTETVTSTSTMGNGGAVVYEQPVPVYEEVVYVPGYTGPIGCPVPMDQGSFESAKQSISAKSFEDSKLTMAKQVMNSNCMTASQVRTLLDVFGFEDSKLEMAKYAWHRTYDRGNFYKVNDAFQFESTIEDLDEYIQGQR